MTIDFIGIGVPRAGTTYLSSVLATHPEICISHSKETHFFLTGELRGKATPREQYYETDGLNAIERYFSHCKPFSVRGEFSPWYIYDTAALTAIKNEFPDCKYLIVLRDPVSRALSAHRHLLSGGKVPARFEKAAAARPEIIEQSFYASYLENVFSIIPKERVLVMIYEEMISEQEKTMETLANFLGVSNNFDIASDDILQNASYTRALPLEKRVYGVLQMFPRLHKIRRAIPRSLRITLKQTARNKLSRRAKPAGEETIAELRSQLIPDIHRTEEILGRTPIANFIGVRHFYVGVIPTK